MMSMSTYSLISICALHRHRAGEGYHVHADEQIMTSSKRIQTFYSKENKVMLRGDKNKDEIKTDVAGVY